MRWISFIRVVFLAVACLLVGLMSLHSQQARAGDCVDPDNICSEPCPAQNSCSGNGTSWGCPGDQICVPSCLPSWCACDPRDASWVCSADCAGECYDWPDPSGPPTHTIIELGTLGGPESHGTAINNYGQIAGEASLPGFTDRHAFFWDNGVMTDLGPASDTVSSRAVDINNLAQVLFGYQGRTFIWDEGFVTEVEGIRDGSAINDSRQVVGRSPVGIGVTHAFLWENGTLIDLWDTFGISGRDINNSGQFAGAVAREEGNHAALWNGAEVVDLGTLGGLFSFAERVNDLGQVLGLSERAPGGDRVFFAFLWDGGELIDLGVEAVPPYSEQALSFNNCGEVLFPGDMRGVVDFYVYHLQRGLYEVRGVIGPTTGWWRLQALDMNDAGQIVGYGQPLGDGRNRGFLISPVVGDYDWDGDCDLGDFAEFAQRMTGPLPPAIHGCQKADIDRDADVDLEDYAQFHNALTGPK